MPTEQGGKQTMFVLLVLGLLQRQYLCETALLHCVTLSCAVLLVS